MLNIVTHSREIRAAQERFAATITNENGETIPARLGYAAGYLSTDVTWLPNQGYWWAFQRIAGSRYWNGFGTVKPRPNSNVSITCEINFPLQGSQRRIGGVFAQDEDTKLYVVHRGKIGGGRRGIGKSLFLRSYRGVWTRLRDGLTEIDVALVGSVDSPRFVDQVGLYVMEVERIKNLASRATQPLDLEPIVARAFAEEFSGARTYSLSRQVQAQCDHGLVVNALSTQLEANGKRTGNDQQRDLYVLTQADTISILFEVKTDVSTSSIYSGIGQLLFNSLGLHPRPHLVLVIPSEANEQLKEGINALGLKTLTFTLGNNTVAFHSLRDFLQ